MRRPAPTRAAEFHSGRPDTGSPSVVVPFCQSLDGATGPRSVRPVGEQVSTSKPFVSVLPSPQPRIASVGTATPRDRFTQEEVADLLEVPEGVGRRFFRTSGIEGRFLFLRPGQSGEFVREDEAQLLERHRRGSLLLGREAIDRCLARLGVSTGDIDFLCCVSSTGFMMPPLSAMYIRHLGFRFDCQRIDIVGMGCNAALNGLNATASWAASNAGRSALLVCCEINSAIHVRDDGVVTALANSLFGDGCAAALVRSGTGTAFGTGPAVLGFASHVVPEAWKAISYHWSRAENKFALYLDKAIPKVLGVHSPTPISALLERFSLCRCNVEHWLVHAGGLRVIRAVAQANGLSEHQMRYATNVLTRAGNLGSATVLFSYEDMLNDGVSCGGDFGTMVTMGPGATIETGLMRW